jgi:hypothetical protein
MSELLASPGCICAFTCPLAKAMCASALSKNFSSSWFCCVSDILLSSFIFGDIVHLFRYNSGIKTSKMIRSDYFIEGQPMTNGEKLKNLLELEIIPDLEVAIDELFAVIDKSKHASKEQKDDLEEMREMRTECFAIVEELRRNELDEEEIDELLAELVDMKTEEDA